MQKIDLNQSLISSFENKVDLFKNKVHKVENRDTNAWGLPNYQEADLQIILASIWPYVIETTPSNTKQKQIKYSNNKLIQQRKQYEKLRKKYNIFLIQDSQNLENTKYIDFRLNFVYHLKWADGITNINDFQKIQKAGIRAVQLVREFNNKIANCHRASEWGLTEFGKEVLSFLDENKIIIDTANMNYQSMIESYKFTKKPIMNSHTNVKALYYQSRNVSDEFLGLVEKSEGLIGLNISSACMVPKEKDATIEDFLAQIKYVKEHVGDDHVAFGSGYHGLYFQKLVKGLEGISGLKTLEKKVIENFGYKFASKFFRENAYRFLQHTI